MPISNELRTRVDASATELLDLLTAQIPWLSEEARKRPPFPRDRADLEISMARLGRVHQLLKAATIMLSAGVKSPRRATENSPTPQQKRRVQGYGSSTTSP